MSENANFSIEVLGTFITRALGLVLGLIASIVLARALGPDGRGMVTALLLYPTLLLTFFEGGFRQATIHALGQRIGKESNVVGAVLVHFVLAAVLSVVATAGLMYFGAEESWSIWQILLAAALVPAGLASALVRGLLLGRQEVLVANLVFRRGKYAYTILLLLLWAVGWLDITTAVAVTVFGQLAGVGVGLRKLAYVGLERPSWSLNMWWMLARRGAVYAAALLVIDMNYRIGMVVLEQSGFIDALGQYTVAAQLAEVLWQLPTAFGFVIFARAAGATNDEVKRVEDRVAKSTRISIALVTVGAVGLAILAPWVVPPVFGAEFTEAPRTILALLPGIIAFTTFKVINTYFAGVGLPNVALILMTPTVLVNFALASWLVRYGAVGIGLAASASYLLAAVAFIIAFQRRTGKVWTEILFVQRSDIAELTGKVKKRLGSR